MSKIRVIGLGLAIAGSTQAASQLEPFFQVIATNPLAAESMSVDLAKANLPEEIPAMLNAMQSGNQRVMNAALQSAIDILRIYDMDGRPNFRKLKRTLPEVIKGLQSLTPVLAAHFGDRAPEVPGVLWKDEFPNTPWKTLVVQFLDSMGESPAPDMVTWMLRVLQESNSRAQKYVA